MIIEDEDEHLPDKKSVIKKQYELDDLFDEDSPKQQEMDNDQSDLNDESDVSDNSVKGPGIFKKRRKRGQNVKKKDKEDTDILDLFFK